MKYACLILLWSLFATMALPADNLIQPISIVPCPESVTPGTGYFTFSGKTDFTVENEEWQRLHAVSLLFLPRRPDLLLV